MRSKDVGLNHTTVAVVLLVEKGGIPRPTPLWELTTRIGKLADQIPRRWTGKAWETSPKRFLAKRGSRLGQGGPLRAFYNRVKD